MVFLVVLFLQKRFLNFNFSYEILNFDLAKLHKYFDKFFLANVKILVQQQILQKNKQTIFITANTQFTTVNHLQVLVIYIQNTYNIHVSHFWDFFIRKHNISTTE